MGQVPAFDASSFARPSGSMWSRRASTPPRRRHSASGLTSLILNGNPAIVTFARGNEYRS